MYFVKFADGTPLHDIRLSLVLQNATVIRELNTVNSFSFSIYKNHPQFENIIPMNEHRFIRVFEDTELLFYGRILKTEGDKPKIVTCEGVLAILNDVLIRFKSASSDNKVVFAVGDFLGTILEKVNTDKSVSDCPIKFAVGNVTVSGSVEIENNEYKKAWELVTEYLLNKFSGYLYPRIEGNTVYVDYVSEITEVCGQAVRVGENIISRKVTDDGEEIATAIIATSTYTDGDTEKNVDLTECASGVFNLLGAKDENGDFVHDTKSEYVYSKSAVSVNGFIAKPYELTENITATDLLKKTITQLESILKLSRSYEFNIVDLSKINPSLPKFKEGLLIDVYDEKISFRILCAKISKNLNNPSADSISLGTTIKFLTKGK